MVFGDCMVVWCGECCGVSGELVVVFVCCMVSCDFGVKEW